MVYADIVVPRWLVGQNIGAVLECQGLSWE